VRINVKAATMTIGLLWGLAMLVIGLANLAWPSYGAAFLHLIASLYPGYEGTADIGQVLVGAIYGLVDGAFGGAAMSWLYNRLAAGPSA